jgi:hypothetical protein
MSQLPSSRYRSGQEAPAGGQFGYGSGVGSGVVVPDARWVGCMQMQLISFVHGLLPAVCMYSPVEPRSVKYTQPNGLYELYDVSETVVSFKLRNVAADSHSALFVMSSTDGQVPVEIV